MRAGRALTAGLVLSLGSAVPLAAVRSDALQKRDCATLYIIVARGSYETPGEGGMGSIASSICGQVPGCDSMGIAYEANMATNAIYITSESGGAQSMLSAAKSYHSQCPDTPLVLMGYSQGAQVVGDAICGHSEPGFTATSPLTGSVADSIISVIQMGDPTFVAGLSYDVGTSRHNGVVERTDVDACESFASRIQSYCDAGDPYCADGDDMDAHHGYMTEYGPAAARYVVSAYSKYVGSTAGDASSQSPKTKTSTSVAAVVTTSATFTTPAAVITDAPVLGGGPVAQAAQDAVVVAWETVVEVDVVTVTVVVTARSVPTATAS